MSKGRKYIKVSSYSGYDRRGGQMKGLHIPTVLVGVLIATIFSAGGVVVLGRTTAIAVEKNTDNLEKKEIRIVLNEKNVAVLQNDVSYIKETVSDVRLSQNSLHSKMDRLLNINGGR